MKKNLYFLFGSIGFVAATASAQITPAGGPAMIHDTIHFTGSVYNYTIPCGVTSVHIETVGAAGAAGATGGNSASGGSGGLGGYAAGDLAVTPGQQLFVVVGGMGATPTGGFNGGGNGGSTNAGGGGGATDIRVNGTNLTDRILVAGGGGGGGRAGCESNTVAGGNGGDGNSIAGANGTDAPTFSGVAGGGAGGTISAGGAAGIGCGGFLGMPGNPGTSGNGGDGGAGQSCCCFTFASVPGGGGGGGGFIGGGGGGGGSAGTTGCSGNDKGAGGGGAGGSCDISGVTNGSIGTPFNTGDGYVVISYADQTPFLPIVAGTVSTCQGGSGVLAVINVDPNADFYTWSVDPGLVFVSGQNTNTITYDAPTAGTYTITVYATDSCVGPGPMQTINVTVHALPTVAAAATSTSVCFDDANVTLVGTPAGGTFSGPGVTGTSFDPSTAGNGAQAVIYNYTDGNGCSSADTLTITVSACTGIAQNAFDASIEMYPNPTKNNLNITVNSNVGDMTIEITDVAGRVVYSSTEKNIQAGFVKQINMSQFPNGNYLVKMNANGQQASHSITLQK
jgi:hypothetical protein